MIRSESHVVPPDFPARPLRRCKKEKIVNRDHLRGSTRGNQQRMLAMHDVRSPGQPFDGWQLEPMPRVIQRPDRDAPIDDSRLQLAIHAGDWPVLPTAREERDLILGCLGERRVGAHQLVHVLADAGPLAQGGSIVDENPHAAKEYHSISAVPHTTAVAASPLASAS
jgi:hypothetical protein